MFFFSVLERSDNRGVWGGGECAGLRRLFALAGKFADGWWTGKEEGVEGAWAVLKAVVPFSQCMCGGGGLLIFCFLFVIFFAVHI